jgi:hypothetical protein
VARLEDAVISYIVSGGRGKAWFLVTELADALYPAVIEGVRAGRCLFCGGVFKARRYLKRHLTGKHMADLVSIARRVAEVYTKFKSSACIRWRRDAVAVRVNGDTLRLSSRRDLAKYIIENFA